MKYFRKCSRYTTDPISNIISLIVVVSLLVLSVFLLTGCSQGNPANVKEANKEKNGFERDILLVGVKSDTLGFHPFMENYEIITLCINSNIFNSLVEFDENFKITPALAESWENPDQLTWRFHLRKGVKFHSGEEMTAEDVKYTVDFIKNDTKSVLRDLLTSVKEVSVVDKYTVDIKTFEPLPILLNKLTDIYIVSKKQLESAGVGEKYIPVGTGPYQFVEHVNDDHVTLKSFDDYWEKKPLIKNVIFKVIKDDLERGNALLAGQIDFATDVPISIISDDILNNKEVKLVTFSVPSITYLSFDFRANNTFDPSFGKNPFSDVRVRKAVYQAIDSDSLINDIVHGYAEQATQFLVPYIFGYDPSIKRFPYDLSAAKELMREAGYEKGFKTVLDCPRYTNNEQACNEVARMLAGINIDVKVNLLPWDEGVMKIAGRNTSFFILSWITVSGDGGEIFDYIIRSVDESKSVGSYNPGYYSNPSVDSLAKESIYTMDFNKRLKLMQEAFRIANDDVAWVPLYSEKSVYLLKSDIEWTPRSDYKIRVSDIKSGNSN